MRFTIEEVQHIVKTGNANAIKDNYYELTLKSL